MLQFSCEIESCNSKFCHSRSLRRHKIKVHGGTQEMHFQTRLKKTCKGEAKSNLNSLLQESPQEMECKGKLEERNASEKTDIQHSSNRQINFLKDVMSEFSGDELSQVLSYCRTVKETSNEEFLDEIIENKNGGMYRPILEELAILGHKVEDVEVQEEYKLSEGEVSKSTSLDHTGKQPFVCEECGQSFKQMGALNGHVIIHTGIKPFECTKCEARFRLSAHLEVHRKILHGTHI